MSSPNLSFNCAVITGGAGGLGRAMAEYFVSLGKKVILVGRTESKLKETAAAMGSNTPYYVLDTGKIADIEPFIQKLLAEHPEVDCLVNNAAIQRPFVDIASKGMDLAGVDQELDINIRGPLHLTVGFLEHLKSKAKGGNGALYVNVGSVLGFLPSSIINPVYNGTKAFMHSWSLNLRTQLRGSGVGVVEVVPPSVGTDLHRERENPDDNKRDKGAVNSLTVDEFMHDFRRGMEAGQDTISAGPGIQLVKRWYDTFGEDYAKAESK